MQDSLVIRSYKNGKSANEIAQKLNVSTSAIMSILNKNGIERRSHSDAAYVKYNPTGDPFHIERNLTPEEDHLKAMALGLYITEGNLKNKNSVKFTNSNPAIVKIFVKFLKVICGVPKEKIRTSLIVYPDVSARKAKEFWSKFLDIPKDRFTKTTVLRKRSSRSPKRHSENGTITVYVHNSKLLNIIRDWLKEYALVAQLVEHIHGKDGVISSNLISGSTRNARKPSIYKGTEKVHL